MKIEVHWTDAETAIGWEDKDTLIADIPKTLCVSMGGLMGYTKNYLILAGDVDIHNKTTNRRIYIPRENIRAIYIMQRGDKISELPKTYELGGAFTDDTPPA